MCHLQKKPIKFYRYYTIFVTKCQKICPCVHINSFQSIVNAFATFCGKSAVWTEGVDSGRFCDIIVASNQGGDPQNNEKCFKTPLG